MSTELRGKPVTIVYEIVDEYLWRQDNPLRYEHHGLRAHTAAAYDAVERCERMREELERLREIVDWSERLSIDAVLSKP